MGLGEGERPLGKGVKREMEARADPCKADAERCGRHITGVPWGSSILRVFTDSGCLLFYTQATVTRSSVRLLGSVSHGGVRKVTEENVCDASLFRLIIRLKGHENRRRSQTLTSQRTEGVGGQESVSSWRTQQAPGL